VERVNGRDRGVVTFGPFNVTASANLADLQAEQGRPPVFASGKTLDQYLAQTKAIRDSAQTSAAAIDADRTYIEGLVVTDLGTSDGQTAALINSPSSDTSAALSAKVVTIGNGQYATRSAVELDIVREFGLPTDGTTSATT